MPMEGQNGHTTPSRDVVQFIDESGEFAFSEDAKSGHGALVTYIEERANFVAKGTDYSIIAILGPQSSGKSTLLNLLFGTRFDTMDAEVGRQQTTQGVWMGVAKNEGSEIILVMDVEGTDGRERGEEEKAFERKTSLFSLAVASVLIINMWMQDIGRYNAANIGLLKTVFELNLQLFQTSSSSKTLLLFVIRDHVLTPLSKLQTIILADMDNIWKGLTKPHGLEESKVTDFFDFAFATLAHKELANEQFLANAMQLRERFTNPKHPDFLLRKEFNKGIPADGLATYSYNIWDTIKSNRDLDLPSQKEMLATYRCEEVMQSSLETFEAELRPYREKVERGEIVDKFGAKAFKLLENATDSYNAVAVRYQSDVSEKKYASLRSRILSELESVFDKTIERLRAKALDFFRSLVAESFAENAKTIQFASLLDSISAQAIKYFEDEVAEASLPAAAAVSWVWDTPLAELQAAISADVERFKREHLAQLTSEAKTTLETELTSPISRILEKPHKNASAMWVDIRNAVESVVQKAEANLKPRLAELALPEEQTRKHLDTLRAYGPTVVRKCVRDAAAHLSLLMQKRFDTLFLMDERGLPRRWSRRDDIPKIFKNARTQAGELVEQFSIIRLSPDDDKIVCIHPTNSDPNNNNKTPLPEIEDTDPRIVLPRRDRTDIVERFRDSTNAAFKSAMLEQEAIASGFHPLLWILILVLGWNEMVTVLSFVLGPMLIPILLLVGVVGYLIWKGQLGGPAFNMAQTVAMAAARQAWGQIQGMVGGRGGGQAAAHPKID